VAPPAPALTRLSRNLAGRAPTVSVVIAVRDGEAYLGEAIGSVRAQTFADWELIVVDDGSTDDTPEIIAAARRQDDRVRVLRQEAGGVSRARNRGCEAARGRYLAILDADDVALPERLALQVPYLDSRPEVAVVGGAGTIVDEGGREIGAAVYPTDPSEAEALLAAGRTPLIQSAATMRTEAFRATAGYRPALKRAQDFELWLQISEHGLVANLGDTVVRYRVHGAQASTRDFEEAAIAVRVALAAARRRRRGEADPLARAAAVDRALAASLGIEGEEIADQELDSALWTARVMARAGHGSQAARIWKRCAARARDASDPRAARRRVLRDRAAALDAEGRRLKALALRVSARAAS
jgi:GT2 family glycosyltransferase